MLLKRLSAENSDQLGTPVTAEEIRKALFSIPNKKSPGPDGFSSCFFKNDWPLVGEEVTEAVLDFFHTGHLSRVVNSTLLALIPKKPHAQHITDYRPIACCNVLYKCIAKVLSNRLVPCLPDVISSSQSAFVKGRHIGDNILMAHELVSAYHLKHTSPRCAFKVDLKKAFDSVDLSYLLVVMDVMSPEGESKINRTSKLIRVEVFPRVLFSVRPSSVSGI
ncbi:Transposon TX1 uncharacterized 149 kDa protein [Linum grandiflorum]